MHPSSASDSRFHDPALLLGNARGSSPSLERMQRLNEEFAKSVQQEAKQRPFSGAPSAADFRELGRAPLKVSASEAFDGKCTGEVRRKIGRLTPEQNTQGIRVANQSMRRIMRIHLP